MSHYEQPSHTPRPRRRRRKRRLRRPYRILRFVLVASLVLFAVSALLSACFKQTQEEAAAPAAVQEDGVEEVLAAAPAPEPKEPEPPLYELRATGETAVLGSEIQSEYAVVVDMDSGEIVAEKNSDSRINPASMTKILTLLVAAEQIPHTEGTFTMTRETANYCFSNECSVVGYEVGEEIPVIELFYGCILCSGADACLGLVELAAGSHEAFVELMNQKVEELGLSETTHFTNCVGVYDKEHYCTVQDMAKLMKAVLDNEFCREVMSTAVYMSQPTPEHPEGQVLSNWFLRRIEDQETEGALVLCGKTGYVPESGNCAVSYGESPEGRGYICVTGKGWSSKQVVNDHAYLYRTYCS